MDKVSEDLIGTTHIKAVENTATTCALFRNDILSLIMVGMGRKKM